MSCTATDVDVALAQRSRLAVEVEVSRVVQRDGLTRRRAGLYQPQVCQLGIPVGMNYVTVRFHVTVVVQESGDSG